MSEAKLLPREPISPSALLGLAEIYSKYAFNLAALITTDDLKIKPLVAFSWGKHHATKKDFKLNPQQIFLGHGYLEECAVYLCALQIDKAFEDTIPNRFNHQDKDIVTASWIARLIRNSFAHNPYNPIWLIDRKCKFQTLEIKKIIRIDLLQVNGWALRDHHYGGPLAMLRFLQHSKKLVRNIEKSLGRKFYIE